MATLRKAADDHFYIIKGYPFENDSGEEDAFFRTLQVGPRADSLFRMLEVKDGYQIDKPLYYCLYVEGEIFFDGKADRPPSPLKIPAHIRYEAEGVYEGSEFAILRDVVSCKQMRSLCDVIQAVAPIETILITGLSLARIAFLVHQRRYDEEIAKWWAKSIAAEIHPSAPEPITEMLRTIAKLIPDGLSRPADVRTFLRQQIPELSENVIGRFVELWQRSR